jgi:predicted dehydrogenase
VSASPSRRQARIGLVGSGFIARCHVYGYRVMATAFPELGADPVLDCVAELTKPLAAAAKARFGFARATADWRKVVEDPAIDIVDICVPSNLHRPIAEAAIAAGKLVYCEKPVGLSGAEASGIAALAARHGIKSLVGYTYLRNPLMAEAKRLIAEGAIGEPLRFQGVHNEDYMSDPDAPFTWRCDPAIGGAAGALGDLGSHIISLARLLMGEISAVAGRIRTVVEDRPIVAGSTERRRVGNEDEAEAMLTFTSGATGHIGASRVATGSKMRIAFEVTGSQGALRFEGERFNELKLYSRRDPANRQGFRTILAGPSHPPFAGFVPAAGHGLGFNDLKAIEIRDLMALWTGAEAPGPNLAEAARIGRIIDAILASAKTGGWREVAL